MENIINHSHHEAIKYLIVHGTEFAAETENVVGLLPTLLGLGVQEFSRRLKNGEENKNPRHKLMKYGCSGWQGSVGPWSQRNQTESETRC